MTCLFTFIYLPLLVLICLISDVFTVDTVQHISVRVLKANCTVNGENKCRNKFLQICYNNKMSGCDRTKPYDCLVHLDLDQGHNDLLAVTGKSSTYANLFKITDFVQVIVQIPQTDQGQPPKSCEIPNTRTNTTNGFTVKTKSADGSYQFDLAIESICTSSNFCGQNCEVCGPTTTLPTTMVTTLDVSKTIMNTSTTFSTLHTTSGLISKVSNTTRTGLKTTQPSSFFTGSLSPTATSEEYSTVSSNFTNHPTKSENSNKQSRLLTVIVAPVGCIVVILIVIIMIYICYRKHNRKSRTTPAGDDKNHLVNDDTEGEDRHSSTDYSNGVQNNKVNLHIENESCDKMAIVATETVDENVNSRGDGNGSISSKQNDINDMSSEIVNTKLEDNELLSNIITEAPEDIEQSNNGVETVSSVHVNTDNSSTHQHKKNKKKKKKRSDAEEDKLSFSKDLSNRNFPADEKNEIANEKNNGYAPDDELSDAGLSNESEEQSTIKSDEIAMSSPVDNKNNNDQEIESKSKSNSQNEDIKLRKSMEDADSSTSNGVQKNRDMTNSEDVSGNDVPSSDNGDVPHQAQHNGDFHHQAQSNGDFHHISKSNGDFHHQEISRKDIENIAQAKVETLLHGKMSEMRRDITEQTNNTINQLKEEVSVLQQDITEKMLQQSNELKEQKNKNTADLEKAERKQQRKMQKLKDQIQECNQRLRIFEDRNNEYNQKQKLIEEKEEASSGKQDKARREIIENKNEIQKLRDEMNRLSEILRQQISQQRGVISVPDTPLFTRTTHVSESSPHSNNLLRSRTASDDALYSRHSGSLATTDQYSELEKKRKKKKKKRTPSIHFPGDGTVHIQHEDNTIDIEQIGPMEVQQVSRGIRLTGGNVEIDIKSPRKKTISPKPQNDQST